VGERQDEKLTKISKIYVGKYKALLEKWVEALETKKCVAIKARIGLIKQPVE
jgi:hypothetical protein